MAELKPLQAELDAALAKVNTWSLSKEKEISNLKASHGAFLDTHNELTIQLKLREKNSKTKMEKMSQAVVKSQQALSEVQLQVEELSKTNDQLPLELDVLKKELEAHKENFCKEEEALDFCQRSREHKKMSLEVGHEIYEKALALRFERDAPGSLAVKMHNIDPQDPKRQYLFRLRVEEESNLYNVLECVPPVDGLEEHVRRLNETCNLSMFVRRLRKAWCAGAVAATAAAARR